MAFDPDKYLAKQTFDPDKYLAKQTFDPDAYLAGKGEPEVITGRQLTPYEKEQYAAGHLPQYQTDPGRAAVKVGEQLKKEWTGKELVKKTPLAGATIKSMENLDLLGAVSRTRGGYDYSKPINEQTMRRAYDPQIAAGQFGAASGMLTRPQYASQKGDLAQIESFLIEQAEQPEMTRGAKIAKGISIMPTWMLEFALTGGLATMGSTAARQAGTKLMGKYATTVAGRTALKAAGWTGGAITRSTLGLSATTAEKATARQIGVQLLETEPEGWATSIVKSWGDVTIEAASEAAGDDIVKAGGWLLSKTKLGAKLIPQLKTAWIGATGGKAADFTRKMFKEGGVTNILGEVGEERLGTILRAITDVDDFGAGVDEQGNKKDATMAERLYAGWQADMEGMDVELPVLLLTMGGQVAVGQAVKAVSKKVYEAEVETTKTEYERATEPKTGQRILEKKPKEYMKGFANRLASVRLSADNILAKAGSKKQLVKTMRKDVQLLKDHYVKIADQIAADPAKFAELKNIQELLPKYEQAVNSFVRKPTKAGFERIKSVEGKLEEQSVQYGAKLGEQTAVEPIPPTDPPAVAKTAKHGETSFGIVDTASGVEVQTPDGKILWQGEGKDAQAQAEKIVAELAKGEVPKNQKPSKWQERAIELMAHKLGMDKKALANLTNETTGFVSVKELTNVEADKLLGVMRTEIKGGPQGFKKPTPAILFRDQVYTSELLGTKKITEAAEIGKQAADVEYVALSNKVDEYIIKIDKLGGTTALDKLHAKVRNVPTPAVRDFMAVMESSEEAPANLSKEEVEIFEFFRDLGRTVWTRENQVREQLGREPIEYREKYVRHIFDGLAESIINQEHPIPEGLKFLSRETLQSKLFNPMELQRTVSEELEDLYSHDLGKATKAMLWVGLKEIHLSEPLKAAEQQLIMLGERMPVSTRTWVKNYLNQVIKGQETDVDMTVNNLLDIGGFRAVVDKMLAPYGRTMSDRAITNFESRAAKLIIFGVMGWRPKQLIRNKIQPIQLLALYPLKANVQSYGTSDPNLQEMMSNSLFLKTYSAFEELPMNAISKLGKYWLAPFQWTAVTNAKTAMKTAYYASRELVVDPNHRDLGWADPNRTYEEAPDFLYPSEKALIEKEMEHGASATQYHYIPMAMPQIFRYKAAVPVTRLQSWWMNYFFKFQREAISRAFTGKTSYGAQIPWSWRLGWARYMIAGGLILNTLGYAGSYAFGAAPDGWPPFATALISLYKMMLYKARGGTKRQKAYAKYKFLTSIKTFLPGYLAYKDVKALWDKERGISNMFFYNKGIFAEEEKKKSTW